MLCCHPYAVATHLRISTIFCRLIGIDHVDSQGETAATQLGEIVIQVHAILKNTQVSR